MSIRDSLHDLNAFIGFRDPEIKSVSVPDMEIQQLVKSTLAARPDRIDMQQVPLDVNFSVGNFHLCPIWICRY